jgi:DNA-binding NarL/FixJ family response regulator
LTALDLISQPAWYELLAYAEMLDGRADEARAWADRATASAALLDLPVRTGFAQLAHAHAALAVDPAAAGRWAMAAAGSFETSGDRVDAGRAYLRAATASAALGETEVARERFARARALFETCGAGLFVDQTARELRRMNARQPRRGTAEPHAVLTDREQEIAKLVAVGLTNRQIAERLYLSPRTVEAHLARLFTKLGVSTRAAVAHALTRPD